MYLLTNMRTLSPFKPKSPNSPNDPFSPFGPGGPSGPKIKFNLHHCNYKMFDYH